MWLLSPGQKLTRHGWEGEYLLYNDLSGDTHLLGELAVELLLELQHPLPLARPSRCSNGR
jgi:hypothetical protein